MSVEERNRLELGQGGGQLWVGFYGFSFSYVNAISIEILETGFEPFAAAGFMFGRTLCIKSFDILRTATP